MNDPSQDRLRQATGPSPTAPEASRAPTTVDHLEAPSAVDSPAVSTALPAAAPTFPGYEILGELGRGGMGVVYKARDTRLGRLVALKVLRAGADADEEELARFKAEAEAVARLQHPNIVQIFEVGGHEGRAFFSLEFVAGGSLRRKLGDTPLPPREAAAVVEKLAGAVQYAHERHLIHRDLKPGNVLLAEDGTPKVADFGLAKRLDVEDGQTRTGAIVGTPSYMAPEQAAGRSRDLGPAVDVYALGAILYECLTGRAPFRGATALETLEEVRTQPPVPPRRLQPKVPRDLETVCLKCLHKDPARRYATALELAQDLKRFQNGEPIRARPVGLLERTWAWAKRRPAVATAAVLAILVVLLGGGGLLALWLYRAAEEGRREAVAARQEADQARRKAEDTQDRLDQILSLQRVQGAVREWQASNVTRARELLEECPPGRRGWEWHYARRLLSPLREISGVLTPITQLQYTADGKRVITAGRIDGLRVWDPIAGRELFYLEGTQPESGKLGGVGHSGATPARFAILADRGEIVACPKGFGPLLVWDLATGKRRGERPAGRGQIKACLALDPKGTWLAYGCGGSNVFDRNIYVIDPRTGKELATFSGHGSPVVSVAASAGGELLASASSDVVKVWDMKEHKERLSFGGPELMVTAVAFHPRSGQVFAIGRAGQLRCWDPGTGTERYRVDARPHQLLALAVRHDGGRLACGTDRGEIQTYEPLTGERREVYRGHLGPLAAVTAVEYSPDGTRLISAGVDRTLRVWDATHGQESSFRRVPVPQGASLALDPRTGAVVAGCQDAGVRRWTLASAQPAGQDRSHTAAVALVAVAAGADRVASASSDGTVRVWDWRADRQVRALPRVADRVQALALSADGKSLAVSGWGGQGSWLRCWDVDSGREIPLPQLKRPVMHLSFTPDGGRLALADDESTLLVLRLPTGEEVFRYRGDRSLGALAFSDDGRMLAGGIGPRVRVWRVDGWKEVLDGWARGDVRQVAFSPDGKRLASGSDEVTVWDLTTGQQALALPGSSPQVVLGFTADGGSLIGATLDGSLTIWEGGPAANGAAPRS